MKSIFFPIIFFIGLICPLVVFAADPAPTPVYFCGQVDIPIIGGIFKKSDPNQKDKAKANCTLIGAGSIAKMTADAYKFIAGIAGIAAVIMMMAGGYVWLFAGGNASKVTEAKSLMSSAVLGLTLTLGSYMILNLINPALVNPKSLSNITGIKPISIKGGGSSSKEINAADYFCTPDDEKSEQAKTKVFDGCGKLISYTETGYTTCMRVSCPAGQVCVINSNEYDGYLISGSGCKSTISAVKNDVSKTFSIQDAASPDCGDINTDGTAVFSNNCGGDLKYTSCTLTRINGEDPGVDASGDHWYDVFLASHKRVKNMECKGDL